MSEEEKKAIGMCRLLLNGDITLHVIDDDGGTAYAGTVNKTYNDDLQTVLNLIEKQQKEIENSVSKDKIEKLEKKYARRCAILLGNATADQWYSMGKNIGRTEAYQELLEGVDSI